jgi:hypothetical protein
MPYQISRGTYSGAGTSVGDGTGTPSGPIPGGPDGGMFKGSLMPGMPGGIDGSGDSGIGDGT